MRTTRSSIYVAATRQRVWRVVTDPAYVKQWQYNSVLETDWAVGSPLRFTSEWEGQYFEQWGFVLAYEEPSKLSYSLFAPSPGLEDRPENYFTMTYELDDIDKGTLLSLVQDDPRESPTSEPDQPLEADNPVLVALKELAESDR